MNITKLKPISIITLIGIYIVLFFFPNSSYQEGYTLFKTFLAFLTDNNSFLETLLNLLVTSPFLLLFAATIYFILFIIEKTEKQKKISRTLAFLSAGAFVVLFGLLYIKADTGFTVTEIIFVTLIIVFGFILNQKDNSKTSLNEKNVSGNDAIKTNQTTILEIVKFLLMITGYLFVLGYIIMGYYFVWAYSKPENDNDYTFVERKINEVMGLSADKKEQSRIQVKNYIESISWAKKISFIVIYTGVYILLVRSVNWLDDNI